MKEGQANKRVFKRKKNMEIDDTNTLVGSSSVILSNQSSFDTPPSITTIHHDDDLNQTSKNIKSKYLKKSVSAEPSKRQIMEEDDDFRNDVIMTRGQPVQSKSLSMVVTINKSDEEHNKEKNGGQMTSFVTLLSVMYAITVAIVGLLVPLAGSIQSWLKKNILMTLFELYIYMVSIVFLVYFQVVMIDLKCPPCKKNKQKDEENDDVNIINNNIDIIDHLTSTSNNNNDDDDYFRNTKQQTNSNNINRNGSMETSKLYHSTLSVSNYKDKEFCNSSLAKSHKSSDVAPPVTAMIRFNSSTKIVSESISSLKKTQDRSLSAEESRQSRRADLLEGIPRVDEVRYVDEEVVEEVYIDLSQLGNIFSHNGSSFFLRIGTLLFGIGHMIFIMLELENSANDKLDCLISSVWWAYAIRLMFVFVQTFVIFKHPGITPNRGNGILLRCGLMHVMASNMCIWVKTLMSEISYESNTFTDKSDNHAGHTYDLNHTLGDADSLSNCTQSILHKLAPILFPFIMEYCLLCISVLAVMFWTLKDNMKNDIQKGLTNIFKIDVFVMDKEKDTISVKEQGKSHEDGMFGKSHRGIFFGFVIIAGVLIVVAFVNFGQMGLVRCGDKDLKVCKEYIYLISSLLLIVILLVGVVAGIISTNPLSFIKRPCSIDDALLIIAMVGGVMYHMILIMSSMHALNQLSYKDFGLEALRITTSVVSLLFLYAQVILVTSGLRRYPSRHSQVENKPGKSYITFLVVANIGSWIFHSMLASNHEFQARPKVLFDKTAGIILSTISLPFLIFFFLSFERLPGGHMAPGLHPLQSKLRKPIPPAENATTSIGNRFENPEATTQPSVYTNSQQYLTDGNKAKSALSLLNPLIRSISVSQLPQSQVQTQSGNSKQLEKNMHSGSLSQLQENHQTNQKSYFSKFNRLSPLVSQTECKTLDCEDDVSTSNATVITVTSVNGDNNNNINDSYNKYNVSGFDGEDNDNVYSMHM